MCPSVGAVSHHFVSRGRGRVFGGSWGGGQSGRMRSCVPKGQALLGWGSHKRFVSPVHCPLARERVEALSKGGNERAGSGDGGKAGSLGPDVLADLRHWFWPVLTATLGLGSPGLSHLPLIHMLLLLSSGHLFFVPFNHYT